MQFKQDSLVAYNFMMLSAGLLVFVAVALFVIQPEIDPKWFSISLLLVVSALSGLFLRGLRRKLYFGSDISMHQSFSFEVVVQMLQAISPLMSRLAFEIEFTTRETGLPRSRITEWLHSRKNALPVIFLLTLSLMLVINDLIAMAYLLLAVSIVIGVLGGIKQTQRAAHFRSLVSGVFIWLIEGSLFVIATSPVIPTVEAILAYILFTLIIELSIIPLALGIAESVALIGLFYANATDLLAVIIIFHAMRLLPLIPLGTIYLARYKLRFLDLLDTNLINFLARTQRPAGGWVYEESSDREELLSVIIPAYNEKKRLPSYLNEIRTVLNKLKVSAEVLIVDDGSTDGTAGYVQSIAEIDQRVRLVSQIKNGGKGRAVQRGMLEGKGKYLLFADADGATPFIEIKSLLDSAKDGSEICIGSRRITSETATRERKGLRALMGQTFYAFVNFLAVPGIRDTQCGFKMFRRDAAKEIFTNLSEYGWAFDVEVLYRAQLKGYAIAEVGVDWHEVDGSKVNPIKDAIKMFMAIFRIRKNNAGFLRQSPSEIIDQSSNVASSSCVS